MQGLILRLSALDPDAGAAVRVIDYFDTLVRQRAGLVAIVRAAALLTGSAAALVDPVRGVHLRVDPDGRSGVPGPPSPSWPASVPADDGLTFWLERDAPPRTVDEVTIERAAAAARDVLDRTRGHVGGHGSRRTDPHLHDEADVEVVLDPDASTSERILAAKRLHLDLGLPTRVLARPAAPPQLEQLPVHHPERGVDPAPTSVGSVGSVGSGAAHGPTVASRVGIGPWVDVLDLPACAAAAATALRFTAEGTEEDPGDRVVAADALGTLALLADCVSADSRPGPDSHVLEAALAAGPWMLPTLHALTITTSVRSASALLRVHHSTVQDRVAIARRRLGWDPTTPAGRHRLHLALMVRRLQRQVERPVDLSLAASAGSAPVR